MTNKRPKLDFKDIQGLVIRSYKDLSCGVYVCFKILDAGRFKHWLGKALEAGFITPATVRETTGGTRQAVAFTHAGLHKLAGDAAGDYPPEFVEGMVQQHRSRLLGDYGKNAPEQWAWGNGDGIDGVLMCFAASSQELNAVVDSALRAVNGLEQVSRIDAHLPADGKEPFGFADGISQPVITGTDRDKDLRTSRPRDHQLNAVAAGEFILGYPDGTAELPRSPVFSPARDVAEILPAHHERPEMRDFGRNGSFMVLRQLSQDVEAFTAFTEKHSREGMDLAEKMVGRTREGKILSYDPEAISANDFDYLNDLNGRGCPVGAHVRRSNPRSTVHESSQQGSLKVSNRHRMIRRGRVYKNDDGETGLVFVCLNASINRQFEFVQSTWSNDPFFQGLNGEADPLTGTRREGARNFTLPALPCREKIKDLPQWVTVKGGAYFFMPGLAALAALLQC